MNSKKTILVILIFSLTAALLYANGPDLFLPDPVSALVDRAVNFVVDSVPFSRSQNVDVAVRGLGMEGRMPAFGQLFGMTVSTRLANQGLEGIRIRTHLPVDSYLSEYTSLGGIPASAEGEEYISTLDYLLTGEVFTGDDVVHVLVQLIHVPTESITGGFEDALELDSWLYDMLQFQRGDEGGEGYVSADHYEPDSINSPLVLSPGDGVENRTISPEGDEDWFYLTSEEHTTELVLTLGTAGDTDTYIAVYASDDLDSVLAENDDGDDANAIVSIVLKPGESVWARVTGYDESVTGFYSFVSEVEPFEGDPLEPNNVMEQASRLEIDGNWISSTILPGTDVDWYYIDVSSAPDPNTIVSIGLMSEMDTFLELFNEDGIQILTNDDGGEGENARIDVFLSEAGRYFIIARHYDGSGQGDYEIHAEYLRASPDQFESDDTRTSARSIPTNGQVQIRNFTPADDQDWVKFDLSETRTVVIETYGDVDTYMKLFDRAGNLVIEDDDSGGDYNARIERLLQRGEYYINVYQVEGDSVFGAGYRIAVVRE